LQFATTQLVEGASGVLAQALGPAERSRFGIELYDAHYRAPLEKTELYPWETRWFDEALPGGPARILVTASGGGREVGALLARGDEVDAFEPADRPRAHAVSLYGDQVDFLRGDYADLCSAVSGDRSSPLSAFAFRGYDAVLLGWGSFTHLPDAESRVAVLRACDALTPGPILASFYYAAPGDTGDRGRPAADLGAAIGRRIARLRGTEGIDDVFVFRSWGGFAHQLTMIDVETAARSVGRRVRWYLDDGFPHVTITRR